MHVSIAGAHGTPASIREPAAENSGKDELYQLRIFQPEELQSAYKVKTVHGNIAWNSMLGLNARESSFGGTQVSRGDRCRH